MQRDDGIKPQLGEVGDVIVGKPGATKDRVDMPQATRLARARALATDIREIDALSAANEGVLNLAAATDEHTDLAADLSGEPSKMSGKFGADELGGGDASVVRAFNGAALAGL